MFDLHNYHFIWYIIGFLFAPRVTLAIIVSVYTPIALWLKICMWIIIFFSSSTTTTE